MERNGTIMDKLEGIDLKEICRKMRLDIIDMSKAAGASGLHFGGSLSMVEIAAALYCRVMSIDPDNLQDPIRDRFILSKGHGVPAVYAALHQIGLIDDQKLKTFKQDESDLGGHPCKNESLGIEFSTGSLGQGLSLGVGNALALKRKGNDTSRVFVILGDGECDEGSIWEAAMSASRYNLDNLVVIVDRNHLQYDGDTEDIIPLESLEDKWSSFGWDCMTIDGHDVEECVQAFSQTKLKPFVVIADTVKGKGISFMENEAGWHHRTMTAAQEQQAMEELNNA